MPRAVLALGLPRPCSRLGLILLPSTALAQAPGPRSSAQAGWPACASVPLRVDFTPGGRGKGKEVCMLVQGIRAAVVVEDSPAGVEGAVAAGMRVFGYAGGIVPAERLARATLLFTDMRRLPELLADQQSPPDGYMEALLRREA